MKRGVALAAAAGLLLALGACAQDQPVAADPNAGRITTSWKVTFDYDIGYDEDWSERQIQLSDGWYITCVTYTGYREGSLSCDYDHPRREVKR